MRRWMEKERIEHKNERQKRTKKISPDQPVINPRQLRRWLISGVGSHSQLRARSADGNNPAMKHHAAGVDAGSNAADGGSPSVVFSVVARCFYFSTTQGSLCCRRLKVSVPFVSVAATLSTIQTLNQSRKREKQSKKRKEKKETTWLAL